MKTHKYLLEKLKKPESELLRKMDKANRSKGKIWTQEEIDYSHAVGKRLAEFFKSGGEE